MDQALDDVIKASRPKKAAGIPARGRGRGRGGGVLAQTGTRRPIPSSTPVVMKPQSLRITVKNDLAVPSRGRGVVKPTQLRVQPRAAPAVTCVLSGLTFRQRLSLHPGNLMHSLQVSISS